MYRIWIRSSKINIRSPLLSPCGDVITPHWIRSSNRRANLLKCVIAIVIMLRIIGSTVPFIGSGRRSILPATNGSQCHGGCHPLLTCGPSVTCSPKTEPKLWKSLKENHQFQSKSVQAKMITSKSINISKCRKIQIQGHAHLRPLSCVTHAKDKEVYFVCCHQKKSLNGKWAKLHTVAASNNRHYPTRSRYYCLFTSHIFVCCSLRTFHLWWITLSTQYQLRSCNNVPSFLQWIPPIAHSFCEGCTWHHLHILVKAPLCCDWKAQAASMQSFTLWW